MLQNEQTSRELVIQGQLQMATLFAKVLKIFKNDNFMHFEFDLGQKGSCGVYFM